MTDPLSSAEIMSDFPRLLRETIRGGGIASSVIDSYDAFIRDDIKAILDSTKIFFPRERKIVDISLLEITSPRNFPNVERREGGYYEAGVRVRLSVRGTDEYADVDLTMIPVMIGSVLDRLVGLSEEERLAQGESRFDPGGYFVMDGNEKILMMQENSKARYPGLFMKKDQQAGMIPVISYTSGEALSGMNSMVLSMTYDRSQGFQTKISGMDRKSSINLFHIYYILFDYLISSYPEGSGFRKKIEGRLSTPDEFYTLVKNQIVLGLPSPREHKNITAATSDALGTGFHEFSQTFGRSYDILIENMPAEGERDKNSLGRFLTREIFKNTPFAENRKTEFVFSKINSLNYIVGKYIGYLSGYRDVEDIDDWRFKKINTAGEHMRAHFAGSITRMVGSLEGGIYKGSIPDFEALVRKIDRREMTEAFRSSFRGQVWGPRRSCSASKEAVIVDTVSRDNLLAIYSHKSRIRTPGSGMSRNDKRQIMNSQYGYGCPITTPDNDMCGLVKDHTITTRITTNVDGRGILDFIRSKGDLLFGQTSPSFGRNLRSGQGIATVLLNGIVVGFTTGRGDELAKFLVSSRRRGEIHMFTEVSLTDKRELLIYTDAGRMVRPLLVVNKEQLEHEVALKNLWGANFDDLLRQGAIEYVGIMEGSYKYTLERPEDLGRMRETIERARGHLERVESRAIESQGVVAAFHDIKDVVNDDSLLEEHLDIQRGLRRLTNDTRPDYTEISPEAIVGVSAASIPFLAMSPGARLTYQAGMGRQALGLDNVNMSGSQRVNTSVSYQLEDPDIPMAYTNVAREIGLDDVPIGQQVLCAFMTYGGGNEEDALVVDKQAIDRGLFKMLAYYGYNSILNIAGQGGEKFGIPPGKEDDPKFAAIINEEGEERGLPRMGSRIAPADCVIAKYSINSDGGISNHSVYSGYADSGVVDYAEKVSSASQGVVTARVRLVDQRKPQVGDKIASRYAQKGIIGHIVPHEYMPSIYAPGNEFLHGVKPSILFNPHGIPSRMTVGKLIEMAAGLIGYAQGKRYNASPFRGSNIDELKKQLEINGFNRRGTFKMYNPLIGKVMENEIFVGPVYYQLLQHFVHKKARALGLDGPVDSGKRQPQQGSRVTGGKISYGSIRFGHMEMTATKGHGMSNVALDRGMVSSDRFHAGFCTCGEQLVVTRSGASLACKKCGKEEGYKVTVPYSFLYMKNLLAGMGINIRAFPEER